MIQRNHPWNVFIVATLIHVGGLAAAGQEPGGWSLANLNPFRKRDAVELPPTSVPNESREQKGWRLPKMPKLPKLPRIKGMDKVTAAVSRVTESERFRGTFEPQEGSMDLSVRQLLREGPWATTRRHNRRNVA